MSFIIVCLIAISINWILKQKNNEIVEVEKNNEKLGLRKPRMYDGYAGDTCEQFKNECRKHSMIEYHMPNLCTYLRILERKNMHLELVKDGQVRYGYSRDEYIDSDPWGKKWNRIVFSANITADDFCDCIKFIMKAHNLKESQNRIICKSSDYPIYPFEKNDGKIRTNCSYFIYRALHIMHYHILICENDPNLKDYEISNSKQLSEVEGCPINEIYEIKKLEELAEFKVAYHFNEGAIVTGGEDPLIVFPENISSGRPNSNNLRYGYGHTEIDADYIVLGLKTPFDIKIWNEYSVISDNIAGIAVNTHIISCEYLFLYLKLMCHKLKINNADEINIKALEETNIVVVPAHIQREIIKKGMPVQDDAEQLETVFSSYNDAYPLLRLVSK